MREHGQQKLQTVDSFQPTLKKGEIHYLTVFLCVYIMGLLGICEPISHFHAYTTVVFTDYEFLSLKVIRHTNWLTWRTVQIQV